MTGASWPTKTPRYTGRLVFLHPPSDAWEPDPIIATYLEPFDHLGALRDRVRAVLNALPADVLNDLLGDPRFRLSLDDFVPGGGRTVWMASPEPGGDGSRCVVLKPRLADCPEAFAHYIIAHELAHAYLRNGGWGDIVDPEAAADALADSWGFPRQSR